MDMRLKGNRIKALRAGKMWSQEELARASGLGLRTIQRVEKEGKGSNETVKALASVFELEALKLVVADEELAPYQRSQPGYTVIIICVLVVGAMWGAISELDMLASWLELLMFLPVVIICTLFYSFNVSVTEAGIAWSFGPGFLKKRFDFSSINACRIVSISWFTGGGFGIRKLGNGWLYRVCGTQAVELELKSGSVILLGTDEPRFLQAAIERYLG